MSTRALAIACATAAFFVAAAGAEAKLVTASGAVPLDPAQSVSVTANATCPAGSNVLSGGWHTTAGTMHIYESRRTGKRSWTVSGYRWTNDLTPGELIAYAYCDTKARRALQGVEELTIPTQTQGTATATCGNGRATAGGFFIDTATVGATGPVLVSDGFGDWKVRIANQSSGGSATFHAYAYCWRPKPKGGFHTRSRLRKGSEPFQVSVRTRRCASKKFKRSRALSGGFRMAAVASPDPMLTSFRRARGGWGATVKDADNERRSLRVRALCTGGSLKP